MQTNGWLAELSCGHLKFITLAIDSKPPKTATCPKCGEGAGR